MVASPVYDYWGCQPSMIIRTQPLTSAAFKPFGEVLETHGVTPELINHGNTQKYADQACITLGNEGRAQVSIYRSSAIDLPFRIRTMERHPLGSQAFFPLHTRPFPIVVALPGVTPCLNTIRVFLSNGKQGVNIHPGVWHHYQLTLDEDSEYLVIDRGGPGNNCDECQIEQEVLLSL